MLCMAASEVGADTVRPAPPPVWVMVRAVAVPLSVSDAVCAEIEPVAVRLPVMAWLPTKVLATFRRGTLVVYRFSVRLPLLPPPVRSVPAVTPVIVPVPAEAQPHAVPVHCSI